MYKATVSPENDLGVPLKIFLVNWSLSIIALKNHLRICANHQGMQTARPLLDHQSYFSLRYQNTNLFQTNLLALSPSTINLTRWLFVFSCFNRRKLLLLLHLMLVLSNGNIFSIDKYLFRNDMISFVVHRDFVNSCNRC